MNTRSFIKTGLLAIAAAFTAPFALKAEEPKTNDTNLRAIWRHGKRIRMQQLHKGEVFEVEMFGGTGIARRETHIALSHPQIVHHPERPGEYTWGIASVQVESISRLHSKN